jgi:predicted RNA-binding Zn-ribbon protein involved in translation (DUF1610 family)
MNCPGCHTPLRLRDDLAGKKIKCPRCGKVVAVPAEEVVTLEEVADDAITSEPSVRNKADKKSIATRPCPECGEPVAVTATKCRHCKAILDDDDEAEEEERGPRRSKYKPCPSCGATGAKRVVWTFWGSFYGPALFTHVRCPECACAYNGRTGGSNLIPAIIFVAVPLFILFAILASVVWFIHRQGYF